MARRVGQGDPWRAQAPLPLLPLEIGIVVLPDFGARAWTWAQRQLVEYEQRAVEMAGFLREGVMRGARYRNAAWVGGCCMGRRPRTRFAHGRSMRRTRHAAISVGESMRRR